MWYSFLLGSALLIGDCASSNVVMGGYDVVAYHDLEASDHGVKGTSSLTSTWTVGANKYDFYFSTEDNMALFSSDPWKYAPKYGGY
mmetsp:Transcript_32073/g.37702  ORF Transcript_32073/g.37702 Transcript_32073/m.37702 type:complete len:86 (+) Transcript_32073:82-339(+)